MLAGCDVGTPSSTLSRVRQAIADGGLDLEDTGVVMVRQRASGRGCSASVVAPNLVLTARHCVSDFGTDGVTCGRTAFQEVLPAASLEVLVGADFAAPDDTLTVSEVWPVPSDGGFCDNDATVLLLGPASPTSSLRMLRPQLDAPLRAGDGYSAIGFGATRDTGDGFGLRRRRDALTVDCVGNGCGVPDVGSREWQASYGLCRGDSGGPAVDPEGRLVGIASRAVARCEAPIYSSLFELRGWLIESAHQASVRGSYPLPEWARQDVEPSVMSLSPEVTSGCAVGAWQTPAVSLGVAVLSARRRLRRARSRNGVAGSR